MTDDGSSHIQIDRQVSDAEAQTDDGAVAETEPGRARRRWPLLAALIGLLVLGGVYGVDLLVSAGTVPRGVVVAGVEVGGLTRAEAESRLTERLASRLAEPVTVVGADGARAVLDPRGVNVTADWAATLDRAGDQPVAPWTRVRSLFTTTEVSPVLSRADGAALVNVLGPQVLPTERPASDARLRFADGRPSVEPSVAGRRVDWDRLAAALPEVLARPRDRVVELAYRTVPPAVGTEQVTALGVNEVIGEFTTKGFARDSGVNIRVVAEKVNGAVLPPGGTFSLNGFTGPRGRAQGYVEAGVIEEGVPARAVGGGISQFATTMYNASYFAAMTDVEHKEHSYYISRYPMGREATVFQNPNGSSVIDLKFRNDNPTAVAIQTIWTPATITVKLWGTKRYTIESVNGGRYGSTGAPTTIKPPGESCRASKGQSGFSTSDTQIVRDLTGKEIRRTPRTVVYNPVPAIRCQAEKPTP
ncbi:vancomycin resistance protein YoaR [Herbihabitans rhizosphaerae]|uniref:Vancomycin resistance protein YoaR n=1 Tax=Herbihabitans rhizosphaerae TaxID=1872711 RepID=A0A4Q7L369_9PSEU|nr:VanW family protein [Herbihabitans rhizosphaerae]RZS43586.1 vancomycin resistance protein YoaR [Herbihabitans rhizosphaerae]